MYTIGLGIIARVLASSGLEAKSLALAGPWGQNFGVKASISVL